jgi:hypothetical protein
MVPATPQAAQLLEESVGPGEIVVLQRPASLKGIPLGTGGTAEPRLSPEDAASDAVRRAVERQVLKGVAFIATPDLVNALSQPEADMSNAMSVDAVEYQPSSNADQDLRSIQVLIPEQLVPETTEILEDTILFVADRDITNEQALELRTAFRNPAISRPIGQGPYMTSTENWREQLQALAVVALLLLTVSRATIALLALESESDHALIAAVGGTPAIRRKLVGIQAGTQLAIALAIAVLLYGGLAIAFREFEGTPIWLLLGFATLPIVAGAFAALTAGGSNPVLSRRTI